MTGPGGDEVGKVSIRVVPDTSGFRRDLKNELEAIEKSLKLKIPVELGDIDTAGLKAQLEALEKSKVTIPVDLGDGTEIERLRARLQALENAQVDIPVEFDPRGIERIEAVVRRLDGRSIRMNVRLNGVRQAIRDLTALDALVRRLDGRRINIGIDVDAAAAIAQIAAIEAALVGVRASLGTIGRGGGEAFGQNSALIGGATQFVGLLLQAGALALGLSVAGAAVTAAWGAVSTAILAIPPALFLLAAPIAAIATGMDGITRAAKTIKPQFEAMQKAVSATFERHMIPVFRTLVRLFPTLTTGLQNSARAVSFLAQSMANMLTSGPGLALIGKTFENINFALLNMHPGIESIVQGFLLLGSQTSIFDALVKAVNTFGEEFRRSVVDVIADGTLDRAMSGLGESLAALSRGFMSLVENGLRVFAAAAPGVNKFLDSLTNFFNRFNWDRLGAAVGRVFEGLGETLDKIDPGTITAIEDAFVRLGDLFKDQKFQDDLKGMVEGLPAVIDQIRAFARDFASAGAAISDAVQGFNTVDQKFREFTDGFTKSAEDLGKSLGLNGPGTIGEWLRDLDDSFDKWLGILPEDAEELGEKTREGWERGLRGGGGTFGTKEGSFGDWLPDIGKMFEDWFGSDDTDLDKPLEDLKTKIKDGLAPLSEIARQAMEQVKLMVQTGLTELLPIVTLGLVGVQTAFTNGWLAIQATTSLAMNTLANTLTLGFVLMQTAVANGMLLLQTAITTGWTLIQLAVDNGLLLMRTAVSEGFLQMQTDATNGMLLFAAAVLAGFAVVVPAVNVGMAQIVLAVQIGFQQIVSAVQTGMQQVTEALQLNWSTAVSATQAAMDQMTAAVQAGMSQIAAAVQVGMQQSQDAVTRGMDAIIGQINVGMDRAHSAVRAGISRMVDALRGAIPQFHQAGANMGQALADGLNSKAGAVEAAARRLANAAAAAVRAAAGIRSPSKVFTDFGEMMGVGLVVGMGHSETDVDRAARSLASTVVDGVSGIQDVLAGDAWAADFSARVNASLSAGDDASIVGELRALRGDAAQPLWAAQLIAELRGLRRDVANTRMGAAAAAQADRRIADLGAFI